MKNYTTLTFNWPHFVDSKQRLVYVFVPDKSSAGSVMKKAMVVYPAHLVTFVPFQKLEELHNDAA